MLNIHLATHTKLNYCRTAPAKGVICMSESRINAPTWLEPGQAVTSIRQLVQYQCALTEGYIHWSMAQTALALTATNPVEYLARQAKLGATLRKQWTDRVAAATSPVAEPATLTAPAVPEVTPLPATAAPLAAAPLATAADSALSPGLAAVLPKLRKANTKSGAKIAELAEPIAPPPANGSLRPLSMPPTLTTTDRSPTANGNGAGAARTASKAAQENLRQKMERARKSSPPKSPGKRV
jgi:hypothetical protein